MIYTSKNSRTEARYQGNLVEIANFNIQICTVLRTPVLECQKYSMFRRYSDESLVSNPAMLHCGVLVSNQQDYSHTGSNPSSPIKSPLMGVAPNRPAPVLKPQIGRKPSIDKNLFEFSTL